LAISGNYKVNPQIFDRTDLKSWIAFTFISMVPYPVKILIFKYLWRKLYLLLLAVTCFVINIKRTYVSDFWFHCSISVPSEIVKLNILWQTIQNRGTMCKGIGNKHAYCTYLWKWKDSNFLMMMMIDRGNTFDNYREMISFRMTKFWYCDYFPH
jgi:hypothetical protein